MSLTFGLRTNFLLVQQKRHFLNAITEKKIVFSNFSKINQKLFINRIILSNFLKTADPSVLMQKKLSILFE